MLWTYVVLTYFVQRSCAKTNFFYSGQFQLPLGWHKVLTGVCFQSIASYSYQIRMLQVFFFLQRLVSWQQHKTKASQPTIRKSPECPLKKQGNAQQRLTHIFSRRGCPYSTIIQVLQIKLNCQ